MLIVCTRDKHIQHFTEKSSSGSNHWQPVCLIHPHFSQNKAHNFMASVLQSLGAQEPLCFSAHGNDYEIGDAESGGKNWGWSPEQIADLIGNNVNPGYKGNILIHACAKKISNFSTRLALQLEQKKILQGVWVFGYNIAIGMHQPYPQPSQMFNEGFELQWAQVRY